MQGVRRGIRRVLYFIFVLCISLVHEYFHYCTTHIHWRRATPENIFWIYVYLFTIMSIRLPHIIIIIIIMLSSTLKHINSHISNKIKRFTSFAYLSATWTGWLCGIFQKHGLYSTTCTSQTQLDGFYMTRRRSQVQANFDLKIAISDLSPAFHERGNAENGLKRRKEAASQYRPIRC